MPPSLNSPSPKDSQTAKVGVFIFDGVELLDFAGPLEVFSVAKSEEGRHCFDVFTFSAQNRPIATINGLRVLGDCHFGNSPTADILVLPGGDGSRLASQDPEVLATLGKMYQHSAIAFSVCSGIRFLARLQLLEGLKVTTHHEVMAELAALAPHAHLDKESRFTDNGKIKTAGGISAGIDLALHVVGEWAGEATRQRAQAYMEYGNWKPLSGL